MAHLAHLAQNSSAALSAVVFNLLDHKTLRKIINYINPNSYRVDGGKIEPVGKIALFGGKVNNVVGKIDQYWITTKTSENG